MVNYMFIENIADPANIPADGILSRTIYEDEQVSAVLFGFSEGEKLSEHTASMPAIIHIIQGDVQLTLGEDVMDASTGAWVHMPANTRHGILAKTPLVMLLLMLKA